MSRPSPRLIAAAAAAAALIIVVIVVRTMRAPKQETPGTPPATATRPGSIAVVPFSPALVQRLTTMLDQAGVAVLPDRVVFESAGGGTITGFAVSEFQVRNMAVEVADGVGGGFYGSQIDDIAPLPKGAPPMSYFLAAWIVQGSTPAAKAAAELMGRRDWTHAPDVVFPSVVLAAFVGDALRYKGSGQPAAPGRGGLGRGIEGIAALTAGLWVSPMLAEEGPCGMISNFIDGMLSFVFDKLKASESDGVLGFIASLWNKAVDLAKAVITGLVEILTAPMTAAVRTAIGLVGVISYAGSLLRPWTVRVEASPNPNRWAVGDEPPPEGLVTARIEDKGFPGWPHALQECAALFGETLPSPDADVGSPVTWTTAGPGRVGTERVSRDETLPADKIAKMRFRIIARETKEDAQQGKPVDQTATIQVGLQRLAMTKLQQFIKGIIHKQIPGIVAPILNPVLSPITDGVLGKLTGYLASNGSAILTIQHHTPVRCKLFTLSEINKALGQNFSVVVTEPSECDVGTPGGPNLGYYYSAANCELAMGAVALVGVVPLNLGPGSFYITAGDRHVVGFPAVSSPKNCVLINAGPKNAFTARNLVNFATRVRPRS